MNLAWVATLAALFAIEKVVLGGPRVARGVGAAMIVGGAVMIAV
ncbi:MAG: hypothetical protein ACR2FK_01755 [Sphingomicrobium sp.]